MNLNDLDTIDVHEVRVVRALAPGDVLIVITDEPVSMHDAEQIKARAREVWPNNECLVTDRRIEFAVMPTTTQ